MEGNGMSKATFKQEIINCLYINHTERSAILRIHAIGLERVVKAGEKLPFEAPKDSFLEEICTHDRSLMMMPPDRIPCIEFAP
jgi:hypothetical protein